MKWSYFNLEKLKPLRLVNRFDDKKGNRFYYFLEGDEAIIASGVTSAFGMVSTEREAINKWKEAHENWQHLLNISSEYGTIEHELYGEIMLNKGVNRNKLESMHAIAYENGKSFDMPAKDVLAFLKFCEDIKLKPIIIEGILVWKDSEGNYLAMTIDLLAEVEVIVKTKELVQEGVYVKGDKKGQAKMVEKTVETPTKKTILVDFKSNFFEKDKKSFYEIHKMQLMAGVKAVEQNFNIKVDAVYNFAPNAWRTEPSYTLYEHNITNQDLNIFDAYWNLIKVKGLNRPSGNIFIADEFKNSSDFKFVSYKEHAENMLKSQTELKLT